MLNLINASVPAYRGLGGGLKVVEVSCFIHQRHLCRRYEDVLLGGAHCGARLVSDALFMQVETGNFCHISFFFSVTLMIKECI